MIRRIFPLFGLFVLAAASLYVVWPSEPDKWLPSAVPWPEGRGVTIGNFERKTIRLGLDLQGGSRLLLQASLPEGAEGDIEDGIEGALSVLRRRVDASGVAEAEVTRQGERNISIQLPGLEPTRPASYSGAPLCSSSARPQGTSAVASLVTTPASGCSPRACSTAYPLR